MDLTSLNKDQQKAVTHDGGPLLVLAGAGSGKTRVLTFRAAWLIEQKNLEPDQVVLLTFTNKAAQEMKDRVQELIGQTPSFAGTFHSFCVRVLRRDGEAINVPQDFVIYDTEDQKDAVKTIIDELNLSPDSYKPAYVLSAISNAKNKMIGPLEFAENAQSEKQEKIFAIYQKYEKMLEEIGALDFDDLLLKTVKLLKTNRDIRNKWQSRIEHTLVDEWQDTNKIQYELAKLLVGDSGNLTAVGDASQSIYSWRGADYRNINYLRKDYPNITVIHLEQNYRSTSTILEAANSVISRNTTHPILNLWTDNSDGERIKLYGAQNGLEEARFVSDKTQQMKRMGYSHSDMVVLYRTNAQSRTLEEALLHQGVPYKIIGGIRFYSRAEIKDVLSMLRLLVNPKDIVSRRRLKKLGVRRTEKFDEFADTLRKNNTTLELMDSVIKATNYLDKYSRETEENFARLENIKELRSVAAEFPDINQFLENVALVEAEQESIIGADDLNSKVTLMTLHAAKGLEFPVVFIVGLEEGLFPHSRSLFDTNEMEEERRLAYVGITRAKELLYLTFANRRIYFGQRSSNPPSRFLSDIPEKLIDSSESFSSTPDPVTEWTFD